MNSGSRGEVDDDLGLVGNSTGIVKLRQTIRRAAKSESTVLLIGETGTGKEIVAKAIHRLSRRSSNPLIAVNCGALNNELLESELFGHVKGAFTNAHSDRRGKLASANGGTVFLDEINSTAPSFQVKLLRVLQERLVAPVGDDREAPIDIRVVAASNRELEPEIDAGRFREDLFYRLNVLPIQIPPLRDRGEDVNLLAQHFLKKCSQSDGRCFGGLSPEMIERLSAYDWPGNVRELENVMQNAIVMSDEDGPDKLLSLPDGFRCRSVRSDVRSDNSIADIVFDELLKSQIPLEGIRKGSTGFGPLANAIVDGVLIGFERFLESEAGRSVLSRKTAPGYFANLIGLGSRSAGNEALLTQKLRSGIEQAVVRRSAGSE